jgi:hypothetical protein
MDVEKYYGYTEEDSATVVQVGDWKWSQEEPEKERDFYEERFGHKITEEEVQENATNTGATAAASEAEAAEGQVTVGGEIQENLESVNGQDELGLFDEALFYHDYEEGGGGYIEAGREIKEGGDDEESEQNRYAGSI